MASRLFRHRLFGFSILILSGLVLAACDNLGSLFPETYQEAEYEMSDTDYRACQLLTVADTDTLGNPLTIKVISLYDSTAAAYDTMTTYDPDATEAEINAAHDALLAVCAAAVLPADTTITLDPPALVEDGDSRSFASYTPAAAGGGDATVIFYLNDQVHLQVMERDGTVMDRLSESMTFEAYGGCTEVIELGPQVYDYEPQMKLRYVYRLTSGTTYLIRLTLMQTYSEAASFRVVILETT